MSESPSFSVRSLGFDDIPNVVSLLTTLNPETPGYLLGLRLESILAEHSHYRLIGAFDGISLVGVAGAWIGTKIWCGKFLEIDNLVVDPGLRSSGIGSTLIRHLESHASAEGCNVVTLDSYTSNHPSHRLYHRLGFEIWGFHFVKPIGDWRGDSASDRSK